MKAIGKHIIIKAIDEEIKTQSGLFLSAEDTNQMRYKKGEVVEPGTEVQSIKSGEIIHYDKGNSFTMMIGDGLFTVIQERDVVVVL